MIAEPDQPAFPAHQSPLLAPLVTLTTDFGEGSRYVAAMKGVILAINPRAPVVDLSHAVPPQDIAAGARLLGEVAPLFPAGTIHVAVIDPDVGTERAIVYAEIGGQRFVCPDNGLLTNLAAADRPGRIIRVEDPRHWRSPVSPTFHGRDIMAPVAARLSLGLAPEELGPAMPAGDLVRLTPREPVMTTLDEGGEPPEGGGVGQRIEGEVVEVDAFGNLITNITAVMLEEAPGGASLIVACEEHKTFGLQKTYADQPAMTLVALIGSGDCLELAIVNDSAAAMLGVGVRAPVVVEW